MRIFFRLENNTCIVRGFDEVLYMDRVTDRLALHEAMEVLSIRKLCVSSMAVATGTKAIFEIEFCLAGRHMIPEAMSEEGLIEWLGMCKDSIYDPGLLIMTLTDEAGKQSKQHYLVYEDAIERLVTGQVWCTTNPADLIPYLGATAATWVLRRIDSIDEHGEYVASAELAF